MSRPLAIDLFCGLGGWTEGLVAEGDDVVGFDIERHVYGEHRYPAQLIVQDVLTLHGSQFRDAALIVASPPCQEFSWMAMPWSRAKQVAAALCGNAEFPDNYRGSRTVADLTRLFDACFRIQREACEAAARHIPMVVENVRGAQPWVGRARWNFGSFYLFGDVPALMPAVLRAPKNVGGSWFSSGVKQRGSGHAWFDKALDERRKNPLKNPGIELGAIGLNVASAHQFGHLVEGVKIVRGERERRQHIGTKRKLASALIAKIPFELSRHIGRTALRRLPS